VKRILKYVGVILVVWLLGGSAIVCLSEQLVLPFLRQTGLEQAYAGLTGVFIFCAIVGAVVLVCRDEHRLPRRMTRPAAADADTAHEAVCPRPPDDQLIDTTLPPESNQEPAAATTQRTPTRRGAGRVVLPLAIGSVALLLLVICGAAVACMLTPAPPPPITLGVTCPPMAYKGQQISLVIEIRNTSNDPQLLHSIRIGEDYARGVAIAGSKPAFSRSTHDAGRDYTYEFLHNIAGQQTLLVYLDGVAVQAGDFSSDLRVCINTPTNCLTQVIRTTVEPATPTPT
jgi:hypothetical protein